jgi:EAL domain-containing protein (putative c-di-GMP-specific phosphodiesterase class I)
MSSHPASSISDYIEPPTAPGGATASLRRMLHAIRTHLGMDVAFISQFRDDRREFRAVDSDLARPPIEEGASDPIEASFCGLVIDGRLPELIHDASRLPAARALAATEALPVGAHLSVPVRLNDGTVYGTFCTFSLRADPSLTERDLALLRVFADLAAELIDRERSATQARAEARRRLANAMAYGSMAIVYQPIFEPRRGEVIGIEALARFDVEPPRGPQALFAEAAAIGWREETELTAAAKALTALDLMAPHHFLSINISPETIRSGGLEHVLAGRPLDRIVLEVTEHAAILEYANLARVLAPLRSRGLRVAIDDAGAGYASFRHVVDMAPDIIKLDLGLTRHVDTDRARRALAGALIGFARETGTKIIAEGVETQAELSVLCELGIDAAQGFLLGRPLPLEKIVTLYPT